MKAESIKIIDAANVTDAVIKAWKEANPRGVWEIAVDTDEEAGTVEGTDKRGLKTITKKYKQHRCFVRKPTRNELSAALTIKNDPLKQVEEIFRDCWLGGDEIILNDEDFFQGAVAQFTDLMEVRNGEIKKL